MSQGIRAADESGNFERPRVLATIPEGDAWKLLEAIENVITSCELPDQKSVSLLCVDRDSQTGMSERTCVSVAGALIATTAAPDSASNALCEISQQACDFTFTICDEAGQGLLELTGLLPDEITWRLAEDTIDAVVARCGHEGDRTKAIDAARVLSLPENAFSTISAHAKFALQETARYAIDRFGPSAKIVFTA